MNETVKNILERRSVRSYLDKPVPCALLDEILKCAQAAPSGMNTQACEFTVIEGRDRLSDFLVSVKNDIADSSSQLWKSAAKDPRFNFYYGAPVFVVVSSDPERYALTPAADCAAAIQNMMIAAKSLGLSSCWVHTLSMVKPLTNGRALLAKWGLPEDHEIFGSLAIGYPSAEAANLKPVRLEGNKIHFCGDK